MARSPDLSVLVMGETGSGKSSVVNLLVGENVAEVSSGASVCTPKTVKHEATISIEVEGQETQIKVHIWEVGGFNQPETKAGKTPTTALDMELGPILQVNGSVDVVLFCMQGPKLKITTTRIFEYVNGVLGGHVPIVPVITKLEWEKENMENWWDRNGERLENMGLNGTGHACITGLQDTKYEAKSAESRASLVSILKGQYSPGRKSTSLEYILKKLVHENPREYNKKTLVKRFKLDPAVAKRLL